MSNLIWSYGDTKLDRQGRTIYFIEYVNQTDSKGNQIELWEPEDIFYYCCVYLVVAYIVLSVSVHFFDSISDDGLIETFRQMLEGCGVGCRPMR